VNKNEIKTLYNDKLVGLNQLFNLHAGVIGVICGKSKKTSEFKIG